MKCRLVSGLLLLTAAAPGAGQTPHQPDIQALERSFASPPQEARPWVWWHWMDGNITIDGIDRDLAWMHRIGIGGLQLFDVSQAGVPQVVEKRLIYMHPEWQAAFRHALTTADRYGMQLGIASSPGWSETGGPWVAPESAMKKLVWSETEAEAGQGPILLPPPPAVPGPFQDVRRDDAAKARGFYRDVAVLAFPAPADASDLPPASVTSSGGTLDQHLLADPGLNHQPGATLPLSTGSPQWIRFDYDRPQTIRSVVVGLTRPGVFDVPPLAALEASDDGVIFRKVADLALSPFVESTLTFAPVTARIFRVTFAPPRDPGQLWRRVADLAAPGNANARFDKPSVQDVRLQRLALLPEARVNRFEDKAGFYAAPDYYALASPAADQGSAVARAQVVDLTSRLKPDGRLDWTPPPGRWRILRLGYSLTGAVNAPAPAEATGYEVDKLDRRAVADYMTSYLATYRAFVPRTELGARGITTILNDSIETGPQNWTGNMIAEFKARRGYDPIPWLPALTGLVVESEEASDRFLWDFRETIAELIADNHYGQTAAGAHAAGLAIRSEALEDHRPVLGDDMAMRSHADEPTGAIWAPNQRGSIEPTSIADLKGAASVAHIYGRRGVAAEAFTSGLAPWAGSPRRLKGVADAALALGVTQFMIHSSVHQPVEGRLPGLTLGIFGQYFNRDETWAEEARPWVDYLARSELMLRQGRYAADIAYFYGEEAPLTGLYGDKRVADVPAGYGFDFVNRDALLTLLAARQGQLTTPSGMRYRALQLGGSSSHMTLAALRQIARFIDAGVIVIGERPVGSPSLGDDAAAFRRLADRLWGSGRVFAGRPAGQVLASLGIGPDWKADPAAPELWVLHRHLADGELYFVSSRSKQASRARMSFRVSGLVPEIWDADTGEIAAIPYQREAGRTAVALDFDPNGSAIIVFRKPGAVTPRPVPRAPTATLVELNAGWTLSFQPERGGPDAPIRAEAGSWTARADPRIRYFSGTGTYARDVRLSAQMLRRGPVWLDLGEVGELAEVKINNVPLRILWKPPYRLDVTRALRPGTNRVEVRVTDLWANRLIGDAQPGAKPITFTSVPTYRPDAPLIPSGLIGPVRLTVPR